jgi:hypothetical protein
MLNSWTTKLASLSRELHFRFAIAAVLVAFHIFAFAHAGNERLQLSFNSAPGEPPAFSEPDAPQLTGRFPRQPHHWSRLVVSRWDAQHYIASALRGISACPRDPKTATDAQYADCGLAWFPAYGETAGVISNVSGVAPDAVLTILSCLAALIVGLLWTSKSIVERIGLGPAYAALVAFNLFPTAFFTVTPYPDSAMLALALGAFICVIRERWLTAALLVGGATALEPTAVGIGFGLAAAAFTSSMRQRELALPRWWRPLLAIPLCAWGVAVTFLVYRIVLGDAFVYFRAQALFSQTHEAGIGDLLDPTFYLKGISTGNLTMISVLGCVAILVIVARDLRRALKIDELMFLGIAGLMVVLREVATIAAHGGGYWQLGRYVLACPIVFLGAGLLARKHRAVYIWWLLVCIGLYWHVELCSYLSHGDPRVCPCLGKFETWMPWQS